MLDSLFYAHYSYREEIKEPVYKFPIKKRQNKQ